MAKSLIDYIARWLGVKFLDREKAKQYHTAELVDRAYSENGSVTKLHLEHNHAQDKIKSSSPLVKFAEPADDRGETVIVFNQNAANSPDGSAAKVIEKANVDAINIEDFSKMQQQLAYRNNNEDAPLCSSCGSVTIRNGACYKCPDCGTTTGCS